MDKLTSILVVVDPADETRQVLSKAMILARHFRARLELFICDSENAYALTHAYDPTGVAEARKACLTSGHRYLDAIRRSLAEDVPVTLHVACESPLYEAVVHRALETKPDLVIKGAAGRHPLQRFALDANDWQLARTCPVALMLTRGQPWNAQPRFAAAVDVTENEGRSIARSILETAGFLSLGCHGELDVVYSNGKAGAEDARRVRVETLGRLVHEFRVGNEHMTVLDGEPEETLPGFAARNQYDVLVMGALTRKRGISTLLGTLTSKLVDALDCDFVLVKPDSYTCPIATARAVESLRT
ncbi:MAG TPA: universal stress protein [Steroidobacteraceae bacterium]|jgi:universal stress protein E